MRELTHTAVRSLPALDAAVLGCLIAQRLAEASLEFTAASFAVLLLAIPFNQYLLRAFGLYDSHRVEHPLQIARDVMLAHCGSAAVCAVLLFVTMPGAAGVILPAFGVAATVIAATKAGLHGILRLARRRGLDQRAVLLAGSWEQARRFDTVLHSHPEWGLRLVCVLSACNSDDSEPAECFSYPDRKPLPTSIEDLLRTRVVDEVLVPVTADSPAHVFEEARRFAPYGLQVRVVFEPDNDAGWSARTEPLKGTPSIQVGPSRLDPTSRALKRIIDLVGAGLLVIALSPLMLAIAVLIRLTSRGPVLFRQTRVGLNGRHFRMLKFRTMVHGADLQVRHLHRSITRGPVFKDTRDYRLTPLGRILRRFSLDELPQFFNVLQGHMSLVGPRPLPVSEADQVTGEYRRRFSVMPGLTCIWQVSGRSDVTYDRWMQYDLQYVDRQSLWFDTVLLFRTIPAVLTGRGAY